MSDTHDAFCGHCGDRLPEYGGKLGFCPPCAKRFKSVLRDREPSDYQRSETPPPPPPPPYRASVGMDQTKDPLLATILSSLVPGGGQVYNGHFLKAVLVFCTSPFVIPWLIGIVDAFFSARRHNQSFIGAAQPA